MSSINWIHHTMHAPDAILEELKAAIEPMLYKDDSAEIITDEDGTHLSVWSLNVDAVCDGIDSVSMRYPDAEIRSRYCASLPGAYHEILAKHIAGHTEIIEDVVHDILDEAGKEMGKYFLMEKALEQFRALNKERPYENIEILEKDGEPIAVESGDALSCFVKREGRYTFKVTIEPCEEIPDPNTAL